MEKEAPINQLPEPFSVFVVPLFKHSSPKHSIYIYWQNSRSIVHHLIYASPETKICTSTGLFAVCVFIRLLPLVEVAGEHKSPYHQSQFGVEDDFDGD